MLATLQRSLPKLLKPGESLLIGVSGGPDSVALLHALVNLGFRPHVCHLNHQWRGAESDADAEFVRQLAAKYQLPATINARSVPKTEVAARDARLEFFGAVARQTGIAKLALAHTADDQVETFLLRLLRGAGVPGLVGIWPERKIGSLRVIRPLLEVRRDEILNYIAGHDLRFCVDPSNADRDFARNRIRHELIPLLERDYNPAIRDVLRRTTEILRDEDYFLIHDIAERFYLRACRHDAVNIQTLSNYPVAVQRRLIRFWLGGEDERGPRFSFEHIEAVRGIALGESPSAEINLPENLVVYREYQWLRKAMLRDLAPLSGEWPLTLDGETSIKELRQRFTCRVVEPAPFGVPPSGEINSVCAERFDADALGDGLFIRTWRDGDRFQPLGMTTEKKLQDFFVDAKVPRRDRNRVPLVCTRDGRIAWVVGHRLGDPFKITDATTRALRIVAKIEGDLAANDAN